MAILSTKEELNEMLFEQFKSFEEQYGRIALLYRLGISYETSNSTLSQPSLPSLTK